MKAPPVKHAMGVGHRQKTEAAKREIAERVFAEDGAPRAPSAMGSALIAVNVLGPPAR